MFPKLLSSIQAQKYYQNRMHYNDASTRDDSARYTVIHQSRRQIAMMKVICFMNEQYKRKEERNAVFHLIKIPSIVGHSVDVRFLDQCG